MALLVDQTSRPPCRRGAPAVSSSAVERLVRVAADACGEEVARGDVGEGDDGGDAGGEVDVDVDVDVDHRCAPRSLRGGSVGVFGLAWAARAGDILA